MDCHGSLCQHQGVKTTHWAHQTLQYVNIRIFQKNIESAALGNCLGHDRSGGIAYRGQHCFSLTSIRIMAQKIAGSNICGLDEETAGNKLKSVGLNYEVETRDMCFELRRFRCSNSLSNRA